jgi:hypothetical protein
MAYACMVLDDIGAEDWVTISRLQGETCLACYSDILVPDILVPVTISRLQGETCLACCSDILVPTRQIFWYLKSDLLVPISNLKS